MGRSRIWLHLWVISACTSGVASSPASPPGPQSAPNAEPPTWTLEETEKQLLDEIARATPTESRRRLLTAFYVIDEAAADRLGDWLRDDERVAATRLDQTTGRTQIQGDAATQGGELSVTEQKWLQLSIESPPKMLRQDDVRRWVRLLGSVPTDIRWRLGPSMVVEAER